MQHERAGIQDRGFGRRRSPPRRGCDRVGPAQAAPCRPASAGTGDDELRWNADHHAGHALPGNVPARAAEQATEQTGEQAPKGAERRRLTTRGSGGPYVPSVQRTPSVGLSQPSGSVYTPPAIANPSERIKDLNSSFPLNGGLGLNPSNRDDYIRYNLNR